MGNLLLTLALLTCYTLEFKMKRHQSLFLLLSLLLFGLLYVWLSHNHFFRNKFVYEEFSFGQDYTIKITAENMDGDFRLLSSVYKNDQAVVLDLFIDVFPTSNLREALPLELIQTNDSQLYSVINKKFPERIYCIFDSTNDILWNATQTEPKKFYSLRRKIEKDNPQTSLLLTGLERLKKSTNEDSYLILNINFGNRFIQFKNNHIDSSIIIDFPLVSHSLDDKENKIYEVKDVESLPILGSKYKQEIIIEQAVQNEIESILQKYGLDFKQKYQIAFDSDNSLTATFHFIEGTLSTSNEDTLKLIYEIIETAYGISEYSILTNGSF